MAVVARILGAHEILIYGVRVAGLDPPGRRGRKATKPDEGRILFNWVFA